MHVLYKIVKTAIEPANLFCLLLLLGGIASVSRNAGLSAFGRRLCLALGLLLFLSSVFPLGHWLLAGLENRFPPERPERVDGIILLAGDEDPFLTGARGQAALGSAARRHMAFAALARAYPEARLAFVGGNSALRPRGSLTNADVARMSMKELGIDPDRLVYENASRNTYENAAYSFSMIRPEKGQNWLLVTSAAHMPRALLAFRKAGWNVFPAPAAYETAPGDRITGGFHVLWRMKELHTAVHEYTGLAFYALTGRI